MKCAHRCYFRIHQSLGSLLILTVLVPGAWAGQIQRTDGERPVVQAVRLSPEEEITLDGQLKEAVWERAAPATDFKQLDPINGEPATERTEIRVVFEENNLYIGAEFFDSNPDGLLANQMIRDGSLGCGRPFHVGDRPAKRPAQRILLRSQPGRGHGRRTVGTGYRRHVRHH